MDEELQLRRETFPIGLAHLGLESVEREIPRDEPPALAPNDELRQIGNNVCRWDALTKVTGAACYTFDVQLPGMLHAAILRSPWAHARIRSIDLSRAVTAPGVRAALNRVEPLTAGVPVVLRYVGQPVAALAAETPELAQAALELIDVKNEPLPFVVFPGSARQSTAPIVYQKSDLEKIPSAGLPANAAAYRLEGNIPGPDGKNSFGDVGVGFTEAAVVVNATYQTQVQTHCCMEPHAVVASWHEKGLDIWMSTQFTAGVRAQFAHYFQLPLSRVRVRAEVVGGGFGSKSQMGLYGRTAA